MKTGDTAAIFSCTGVYSTLPVDHTNIAKFKILISFEFEDIYSSRTMPIKVWVYVVIIAVWYKIGDCVVGKGGGGHLRSESSLRNWCEEQQR